MNGELRSLINRLTQDIIDSFNIQVPIIDMAEVVRLLGGSVEATPNVCDRAEGSIRKLDNSFVIYVSTFQTKERRQFTIAHELGHLFLHMVLFF